MPNTLAATNLNLQVEIYIGIFARKWFCFLVLTTKRHTWYWKSTLTLDSRERKGETNNNFYNNIHIFSCNCRMADYKDIRFQIHAGFEKQHHNKDSLLKNI